MGSRQAGLLAIAVAGTVLLLALGVWQVQRLQWKTAILDEIAARIDGTPTALPDRPDAARDRFLPVEVRGRIGAPTLRVVTADDGGAAFRLISPFHVGDRLVLLDRGVVPAYAADPPAPQGEILVTGNLHWPDETDAFTPAPDIAEGLWYARDAAAMSEVLGTEPVMIVARSIPGDGAAPRPITTAGIPNDHLEYAITWFALAAIWAGMTATLLWRIRRRTG